MSIICRGPPVDSTRLTGTSIEICRPSRLFSSAGPPGSRPFSKNTVGPIKSGPEETRASFLFLSLALSSRVRFVSILIGTIRGAMKIARESPVLVFRPPQRFSLFVSLFLVLPRPPRRAARAVERIPSRSPTRFRFYTYELNSGGPIKRKHAKEIA